MVRKPQRQAAMGRVERISLPRATAEVDVESYSKASLEEKGHFVIYTFDRKRFVIPLAYLSNDIFRELLKLSEEEFGLLSDEPITLPCEAAFMTFIVSLIKCGAAKGHLHQASNPDIMVFLRTPDKRRMRTMKELAKKLFLILMKPEFLTRGSSHLWMKKTLFKEVPKRFEGFYGTDGTLYRNEGNKTQEFFESVVEGMGFRSSDQLKEHFLVLRHDQMKYPQIATMLSEMVFLRTPDIRRMRTMEELSNKLWFYDTDGMFYRNEGKKTQEFFESVVESMSFRSSDPLKEPFLVLRRDQMKYAQIATMLSEMGRAVKEALFDLDETGILDGRIITLVDEKNSSKKYLKVLKLMERFTITRARGRGNTSRVLSKAWLLGSLVGLKL
ncbi:hypothetical protein EZV62_011972 [Acer yangbiense]|uniref:Uncharacterized protein n=1 Tax=Acer yangbiense TaxID=1000413 RepID=A0A5C7I7F4_9ROSI|nr:hypothetical protein EZV62_011972 [Acer yangbiense]